MTILTLFVLSAAVIYAYTYKSPTPVRIYIKTNDKK